MKIRTAFIAIAAPVAVVGAQGVRVNGWSFAQYVELRPVAADSIADSLTTGTSLVRSSPVGLVSCPEGQRHCYFYRSLATTHTIPFTQDIQATAWGLGQGISVYTHLRARANLGGVTELWTRAGDPFNSLAAYVEIDRQRWLARAGRQWLTSQLGVNNFDGVSLALRAPSPQLEVEGYAGRSLIQGLSVSYTSSTLAQADVLPPDVQGVILGTTTRWRPTATAAVSAEYQRVIRTDRAGLYSDRVAFDGVATWGSTALSGQLQGDLASHAVNEARLRVSRPLPRGLSGTVEAVHSTPFFPLWTIWGVFAPVGFNEARGAVAWRSDTRALTANLSGGYRRYQNTHTGVGFLPLRDDGWTVIANAGWRPRPVWEMSGSYRRDIGFGASKSDGTASARWWTGDSWIGATASATQTIFEYRLANGYLLGGAVDGSFPLSTSVRLAGMVGIYRQIAANTPSTTVNWSQRRALVRIEWTTALAMAPASVRPADGGTSR